MKFVKVIKAEELNQEALEIIENAELKAKSIAEKYGFKADCYNLKNHATEQLPFYQIRIVTDEYMPQGRAVFDDHGNNRIIVEIPQTNIDLEDHTKYLDNFHKLLSCLEELKEEFF